jgi:hypothetical protein
MPFRNEIVTNVVVAILADIFEKQIELPGSELNIATNVWVSGFRPHRHFLAA